MSGEQATMRIWLEVVSGEEGPELRMTPCSDDAWLSLKRDIYKTHGVILDDKEHRVLRWTGMTAKLLYSTLSAQQKNRIEGSFAVDLGEHSGKIMIHRSYRDVLCNYEEQYT